MEAYKTSCPSCGHVRYWVGYKTGIGKTKEQLERMVRDQKLCVQCGSMDAVTDLDRESSVGQDFAEMDGMVIQAIREALEKPRRLPMLDILHRVEAEMPKLLQDEKAWQGVMIDYEKPIVERLWREISGFRISLHRIQPCIEGESLFHPHPWPSAMRIVDGAYRMPWGYGPGEVPPKVERVNLYGAGSEYEMADRDEWHAVQPVDRPSLSLMVTGPPWSRWAPKSNAPLKKLAPKASQEILSAFRGIYQ